VVRGRGLPVHLTSRRNGETFHHHSKDTKLMAKIISKSAKSAKPVAKAAKISTDAKVRAKVAAKRSEMLAKLYADELKNAEKPQPTADEINGWWGDRADGIIALMKTGLPYKRAVKRTLRFFKTKGGYA
jgi:hypothetical protein